MSEKENTIVYDKMGLLSWEMDEIPGVLYKNDPYQVTIASIVLALNKKFSILTLPTGCGKTFIVGLIYQYLKKYSNKSVAAVVPNDELRDQMVN